MHVGRWTVALFAVLGALAALSGSPLGLAAASVTLSNPRVGVVFLAPLMVGLADAVSVGFASGSIVAEEKDYKAVLEVARDGAFSVDVVFEDGTAIGGVDYSWCAYSSCDYNATGVCTDSFRPEFRLKEGCFRVKLPVNYPSCSSAINSNVRFRTSPHFVPRDDWLFYELLMLMILGIGAAVLLNGFSISRTRNKPKAAIVNSGAVISIFLVSFILSLSTPTNALVPVPIDWTQVTPAHVCVGPTHTCTVLDGQVACFGSSGSGELGIGPAVTPSNAVGQTPASLASIPFLDFYNGGGVKVASKVRGVACGDRFTCAWFADGTVRCWGSDDGVGRLGIANATVLSVGKGGCGSAADLCLTAVGPVQLGGIPFVATKVATGRSHTCILTSTGTMLCFGDNTYRQCGANQNTPAIKHAALAALSGVSWNDLTVSVVDIAAGWHHSCAVFNDGTLRCFGRNHHGQLGQDDNLEYGGSDAGRRTNDIPAVDLGEGREAIKVAAGEAHTCAITAAGLVCFGRNVYGELGIDPDTALSIGGTPDNGTRFENRTCDPPCAEGLTFLNDTCLNASAPGNGTDVLNCTYPLPQQRFLMSFAPNLSVPSAWASGGPEQYGEPIGISAGRSHTCVMLSSGNVTCFGSNTHAAVGQSVPASTHPYVLANDSVVVPMPEFAGSGDPVTMVAAGESTTCAVLGGAHFTCWGTDGTTTGTPGGPFTGNADASPPADPVFGDGSPATELPQGTRRIRVGKTEIISSVPEALPAGTPTGFSLVRRPNAMDISAGGAFEGMLRHPVEHDFNVTAIFVVSSMTDATATFPAIVIPAAGVGQVERWEFLSRTAGAGAGVPFETTGYEVDVFEHVTAEGIDPYPNSPTSGGVTINVNFTYAGLAAVVAKPWVALRCCFAGLNAMTVATALPTGGGVSCPTAAVPAGQGPAYHGVAVDVAVSFNGADCGPRLAASSVVYLHTAGINATLTPRHAPKSANWTGYTIDFGATMPAAFARASESRIVDHLVRFGGQQPTPLTHVSGGLFNYSVVLPTLTAGNKVVEVSVDGGRSWFTVAAPGGSTATMRVYDAFAPKSILLGAAPYRGGTQTRVQSIKCTGDVVVSSNEIVVKLVHNTTGQVILVPGTGSGTADILFISPPFATPGAAQVFVSVDGGFNFNDPASALLLLLMDVVAVSPTGGPRSGGTLVTVSGTGFISAGPSMRCAFGSGAVTTASYRSPTHVTCFSPAASANATGFLALPVGVSLDGVDFTEPGPAVFSLYGNPPVTAVVPAYLPQPPRAGAYITVYGTNFPSLGSLPTTCRADSGTSIVGVIDGANNTIVCPAPSGFGSALISVSFNGGLDYGPAAGKVTYITPVSVDPISVPVVGTSRLQISGSGFPASDPIVCSFTAPSGSVATRLGLLRTASLLECPVPQPLVRGEYKIAVGLQGYPQLSEYPVNLTTFTSPQVTSLSPVAGTSSGGTVITVHGRFLGAHGFGTGLARCVFGDATSTATTVRVSPEPGPDPAAGLDGVAITCASPGGAEAVPVEVSLNGGYDASSSTPPVAFTHVAVQAITPSHGTFAGGTEIAVFTSGLPAAAAAGGSGISVLCRFGPGTAATPAIAVLDTRRVRCRVPPAPPVSSYVSSNGTILLRAPPSSSLDEREAVVEVSVNGGLDFAHDAATKFTYYPPPTVSSVSPPLARSEGGTMVTIAGVGLRSARETTCLFDAVRVTATVKIPGQGSGVNGALLPGTVECVAPKGTGDVAVAVTFNGLDVFVVPGVRLEYYSVIAIAPSWGPETGGTKVRVSGSGFLPGTSFSCRFGGAAPTPAVSLSDALLECVAPASSESSLPLVAAQRLQRRLAPGSGLFARYDVAVAPVGSPDFTTGGDLAKFEYYPSPVVTLVTPREGQTSGGDEVTVRGAGFLDTSSLSCRFGDGGAAATSPAVYVSPTMLRCNSTARVIGNVTVFVSNNAADFLPQPHPNATFSYTQCSPGFFAKIHTDPCTPCPPGYTAPLAGSQKCTLCGRDSFTALKGEPLCRACPENTIVVGDLSDALEKCVCLPGFYEPNGEPGKPCVPCPDGGKCVGGVVRPVALPGFWNDLDAATGEVIFLECDGSEQCPGGGTVACSEGHTGRLCSECEAGYFKSQRVCRVCPDGAMFMMIGFALFCVVICAAIFKVVGAKGAHRYGGTVAVAVDFFQVLAIVGDLPLDWPPEIKSVIAIVSAPFFLSLELLASECSVPDVSYPAVWTATMMVPLFFAFIFGMFFVGALVQNIIVGRILGRRRAEEHLAIEDTVDANGKGTTNASANANANANDGAASVAGSRKSLLGGANNDDLYLTEPVDSNGDGDGDGGSGDGKKKKKKSADGGGESSSRGGFMASLRRLATEPIDLHSFADKIINCLLMFFVLSYLLVISAAFEFFDCTLRPDGTWTLDASPSLLCFDDWWMDLLPIGVLGVGVYGIAIPIAFAGIVRYHRHSLRIPRVFERFSALYFEYRDEYAFWGTASMLEKFAIGVASTYLSGYLSLQIVILLVILLTILLLGSAYKPMVEHRNNTLENVLRFCMCIVLLCGLLFKSGNFPSEFANKSLTWACMLVIFSAVLFVIWIVASDLFHTYREESQSIPPRLDHLASDLMCPNGYGLVVEYVRSRNTTEEEVRLLERVLIRIERYASATLIRGTARFESNPADLIVDRYTSNCFTPILLPDLGSWLRMCTARARGFGGASGKNSSTKKKSDGYAGIGGGDASAEERDYAALEALIEFQRCFSAIAEFDHMRSMTNTALPFRKPPAEHVSSIATMRGVGREGHINVIREEVVNDKAEAMPQLAPLEDGGLGVGGTGAGDVDVDVDVDGNTATAYGGEFRSPRLHNITSAAAAGTGGAAAGGIGGGKGAVLRTGALGSPAGDSAPSSSKRLAARPLTSGATVAVPRRSRAPSDADASDHRGGFAWVPTATLQSDGDRSSMSEFGDDGGGSTMSASVGRPARGGRGGGSNIATASTSGNGSGRNIDRNRNAGSGAGTAAGGTLTGGTTTGATRGDPPMTPRTAARARAAEEAIAAHPLPMLSPRKTMKLFDQTASVAATTDAGSSYISSEEVSDDQFDYAQQGAGSLASSSLGGGKQHAFSNNKNDKRKGKGRSSSTSINKGKGKRGPGGNDAITPFDTAIEIESLPATALALGTLLGLMTGLDGEVLEDTTAGIGAVPGIETRWRFANASDAAVIANAMRTHSLGFPSDDAMWAHLESLYGFENLTDKASAMADVFPRGVADRPKVPYEDFDLYSLSSVEDELIEEEDLVPIDEESGDSFTSDNSACAIQ